MNKLSIKCHLQILSFLILSAILIIACAPKKDKKKVTQQPLGYDLNTYTKYNLPQSLVEISGITFHQGDSSLVYAQQDEEGRIFTFALGDKETHKTKFAINGDFEDVSIAKNKILVLKSNGDIYTFNIEEAKNEEASNVVENLDLVPKGEYEGMFADETTGLVYVLCKNCKVDKTDQKKATGYILALQNDGSLTYQSSFVVDASTLNEITGKKKGQFRPSALAKNPIDGNWYVVSAVNKALIIFDKDWKLNAAYHLSNNVFNQPEGIAFDKFGNMYISNEGSDVEYGNIYKFPYKRP